MRLHRRFLLRRNSDSNCGIAARESVTEALNPENVAEERLNTYCAVAAENRQPLVPACPEWIQRFCTPSASPVSSRYEFLDELPLKDIARYAGDRTIRKVLGGRRHIACT